MKTRPTPEEIEQFNRLADTLSLLPSCPRSPAVLEALAEDLARMCDSLAEAQWLVREARSQWDEWRGVKALAYLLHMKRHPPLPASNLAPDEKTKARWIRERDASEFMDATQEILAGKSSKEQMCEMHLKAIRDMLFYTEGEGQHEKQDGFWQDARQYDLKEHPDLVEWIRGGEVGEMPPLEPMSRRTAPRVRGVPSPVQNPPITAADVERERERWERTKSLAREMNPTEGIQREPGEGE